MTDDKERYKVMVQGSEEREREVRGTLKVMEMERQRWTRSSIVLE